VSERPKGGPNSLFLVDANNFMFRAYHGLPMLTAPDGRPVNAVHGYVRMVQALRREYAPQYMVAVFDAPGPTFRKEIYPDYKANRPPAPEDLRPQIPLTRQATTALGIPMVELEGYEADDLIATYARQGRARGMEVVIVSSDKDLMQLVDTPSDGSSIRLWDTMKTRLVDPEHVKKKYGVEPERLGDLLALAGDSVDNIPGVPGIGPKTAATLLDEYGDLESILAGAASIKQKKRRERMIEHAGDARMSRKLVALCETVPVPTPLERLADPGADVATMEAFFGPLGFKSVLTGGATVSGDARRAAASSADAVASASVLGEADARSQTLAPDEAVTIRAVDRAALETWIAAATDAATKGDAFAVYLETSHEEPMRADIVGVGLASPAAKLDALYVPVAHRTLADAPGTQLDLPVVLELLRPALEDAGLPKFVYAHKPSGVVFARHELTLRGVTMDPMLASYTLDPARNSHAIEDLASDVLSHACIPREKVVGKGRKRVGFDQVDLDRATPYVAERALVTHALSTHLIAQVDAAGPEEHRLFNAVEMPLAEVLRRMELRGVLLDAEELGRQGEELGAQLAEIRGEIEADAGYPINPESPAQLQKLLFEDRGLPAKKKTKTGYSTDASVLEELSLLDPIVKLILEHRSLQKLKGTYLDTLPTLVNDRTGRLHTQFRQAVAQTGRLSSSDPNLQNIPIRSERGRRIRRGFVAPAGQRLVALDYSQIELRVLAHLSGDASLAAAFNDGDDVHARTASEVFEVAREAVTSEQRSIAKAVNFGVIYGQSAFGLARTLGIPQGRASKYIKKYFERIPGVSAYMNELIARAKREGYAETILGRRRRIPELRSRGAARAYGERIARNTPIQGSAADILKLAMVAVEHAIEGETWCQMVLTVHDELIFECDEARVDELIGIVKPAMEQAVALDVPLEVEAGSGRTWEEAKG